MKYQISRLHRLMSAVFLQAIRDSQLADQVLRLHAQEWLRQSGVEFAMDHGLGIQIEELTQFIENGFELSRNQRRSMLNGNRHLNFSKGKHHGHEF